MTTEYPAARDDTGGEHASLRAAAEETLRKKRDRKSLKSMMREGSQLSNIEITDKNIKSFEKVARKYSIDYSLKKDKSVDPPKYLVFSKPGSGRQNPMGIFCPSSKGRS